MYNSSLEHKMSTIYISYIVEMSVLGV